MSYSPKSLVTPSPIYTLKLHRFLADGFRNRFSAGADLNVFRRKLSDARFTIRSQVPRHGPVEIAPAFNHGEGRVKARRACVWLLQQRRKPQCAFALPLPSIVIREEAAILFFNDARTAPL